MGVADVRWPGPRPLFAGGPTEDLREPDYLAGRRQELQELFDACRTYDVISVTGWSGVGKTSFIRAGGLPMLAAAGWHVVTSEPWVQVAERAGLHRSDLTPEEAAERLYRAILDPKGPAESSTAPASVLGAITAAHDRTVVVLDQVEEVLRYLPGTAACLLELVGETARDTRVPHVLITRSEFAERLRPVEVRRLHRWSLRLTEIDADAVRTIVTRPAEAHVRITDEAVDLLVGWWRDAQAAIERQRIGTAGRERLVDVGLLHFHALLWSFKRWAETTVPHDDVTTETLRDFAAHRGGRAGDMPDARRLVERALADYVEQRAVELATLAMSTDHAPDTGPRWANGPSVMLARAAPALLAAGYKQPQSLASLLPYALGDELTPRGARALATSMEHVLAEDGADTPDALRAKAVAGFIASSKQSDRDARSMGAGIAAGWDDAQVIEEMVRCLEDALAYLSRDDVNVLKEIERPGQPIYELVHDGMGFALNDWARTFVTSELAEVGVIAQQIGSALHATLRGAELAALADDQRSRWGLASADEGRQVVSAMRRRGSLVTSPEISDITFRACDFAGVLFKAVRFRNVVFDTCDLRGALFEDCAFDDVVFRADARDPERPAMDLFTVRFSEGGRHADHVRFENVPRTVGFFLEGMARGRWSFSMAHVFNLVITTADDALDADRVIVEFGEGSVIRPVSVYGPCPVFDEKPGSDVTLAPRETDA